MKTATIILGGKSYTISPLTIRPAREWRKNFESTFDEVISLIGGVTDVKLDSPADLAKLIGPLKNILLGAMDRVVELVFAYSPELQAHKDEIEQSATDEEAVDAMVIILGLAYPFGLVVDKFKGLTSGLPSKATLKN